MTSSKAPAASQVPTQDWHRLTPEDALTALQADPTGLSDAERTARTSRSGRNELTADKAEPWWKELGESFTEPLQLLLVGVAVLTGVFGEVRDAIVIGVVVLIVAILETVSEVRAQRSIDALADLTAPTARVLVAGMPTEIPAADVAIGDVIVVEAGDIVPADARLLRARGLRTNESSLTGESQSVGKDVPAVAATAPLAERSDMLFAGSPVVSGEGTAVVVATGSHTELGRLASLVETTKEPPTPLQAAMSQLAKVILVIAVAVSVLVPVVGVLMGQPWQDMVLSGLTLAFATVPEELPILVTALLAVAGHRLAGKGALLRHLRAGETLGDVTTLVTDKTGTLTENELRLTDVIGPRDEVLAVALHTQQPDGSSREPLEVELARAAASEGLVADGTPTAEFPFDATRKRVSRAWRRPDGSSWLAVSGSPESVLACCDLDPTQRDDWGRRVDDLASQGLRLIAFGRRELDTDPSTQEDAESHVTFVGLASFTDPLRPGTRDAVADLDAAGVATIMVTGDHPATATAIGTELGLPVTCLTGAEVAALDDASLLAKLHHGTVIARATPETKHRLVQALQSRGDCVAVTGDGANDAPALAAADVGIALGKHGADIARDAADVVLTDDAYPTAVAAIASGRNVGAQLRRAVAFYIGVKVALVLVMLVALLTRLPVPFQPVHIVLLEIFMDLGASVAFVAEPEAPDAMRRPPRRGAFVDATMIATLLEVMTTLGIAVLPAYLLVAPSDGVPAGRSAALLSWLIAHVLIGWSLRTRPGLAWRENPAFPIWLIVATVVGLVFTLTPAGSILGLAVLSGSALVLVLACVAAGALLAVMLRGTLRLRDYL